MNYQVLCIYAPSGIWNLKEILQCTSSMELAVNYNFSEHIWCLYAQQNWTEEGWHCRNMQQNILAYTMIIKAVVNERLTNVHLLDFGTQNSSRCQKRLGLLVLANFQVIWFILTEFPFLLFTSSATFRLQIHYIVHLCVNSAYYFTLITSLCEMVIWCVRPCYYEPQRFSITLF